MLAASAASAIPARWHHCRSRLRRRTCFFAGRSNQVPSRGRVGGAFLHAGFPAEPEDAWRYTRCPTCFCKTCGQRDEAGGVRPCYSLEATVWDRAATRKVLRAALAFQPGDAVESRENAEREILARKWAARQSIFWADGPSRRAQHLASGACLQDSAYLLGMLACGRFTPWLSTHVLFRRELG